MPHPESFPNPERDPLPESLDRWLWEDLPKHYERQVAFLHEEGLIELLPDAKAMGILGIDGKEYPIPTPEHVTTALTKTPETREAYATKIDQGFTELQLTPFGKPFAQLHELLRRSLLKHHTDGKLFSSDGTTPLDLDTNQPLFVWDKFVNADVSGDLFYFPTKFTKEGHGGKTKQQIMHAGGAWQILLLEPDPTIPREGHAPKPKGNRKRLEAGKTPNEYLQLLTTLSHPSSPPLGQGRKTSSEL